MFGISSFFNLNLPVGRGKDPAWSTTEQFRVLLPNFFNSPVNVGGDCVFDETLDLRRKVAAKRTLGEMEYYRGLLFSLLESLRTSDEERMHHVLEAIRGSDDLNDIATALEALPVEPSDTSLEYPRSIVSVEENNVLQGPLVIDQRSRITVEKLCDNPLFQVPARPWTTVTDDNHLVSHLISLYFVWDHPTIQVIDQERFLRDMASKNTSSKFCTPVLVNSILAVASTYSDFPEVFGVPDDIASRGQHFFMEAERLWQAQEGRPSLANIQAVALMSHSLKLHGKDDISWLMLRQAVQLGQDFGMFKAPRTRHHEWDQMPENVRRICTSTAWGVFILNSTISMDSQKTTNLEFPRSSLDPMNDREEDSIWTPYPQTNHEHYARKPSLVGYAMVRLANLTETIVDIQNLLFDKALDISMNEVWAKAIQLHARLEAFLESLPDTTVLGIPPVPHVLFLYIRCYQISIALFGFFLEKQDLDCLLGPSKVKKARWNQVLAAKQIARYLRLHRENFGFRQTPGTMLGPANSSAFVLVRCLSDKDSIDAFVELYRFIVSFGRRFLPAKETICKINTIIRNSEFKLPFEIVGVLSQGESECS
ncbi:hypothetical protein AOCH_002437 [Aspergillus ochraceoroseus]|uniref:Xylanolytic transcriptional activator regulatory domain-containing protein n=1 Tax=Aspergillus ochraceoroseus TaxID=138278 RepID=A0A0F8WN37_9EURO|nr:hypothetical protein AOCH_002437 [Aspergillus ochraceoroseus]